MSKFVIGEGQYVVYADSTEKAGQVLGQEIQRVNKVKEKIADMLSKDGFAYQNFTKNFADENLNIYFNDNNSYIFDNPEDKDTMGMVSQRKFENGEFKYNLAYRYEGENTDFKLAHEMGHLVLNPSNENSQIYDKETNSRQVSGLIRRDEENSQFYGMEIQENGINLLAELAIREPYSADEVMEGKADVSGFNSYKKVDNLVKLLSVSMRNDFSNELTFEQLVDQKLDSQITNSDGTKEPVNTFFYGLLNDSSMIENEFDKYMGKGAYRELDSAISVLHESDVNSEKFEIIYEQAQGLIEDFANIRMQEKHKEAVARDGDNIPNLDKKLEIINKITGRDIEKVDEINKEEQTKNDFGNGAYINEFGEIIRPNNGKNIKDNNNLENENKVELSQNTKLSFSQRIAQMLQKNSLLSNIPFIQKYIGKQLNLLPERTGSNIENTVSIQNSRQTFINSITNNGEFRNIQIMSDPQRIENMRRKMEQGKPLNDENVR